MNPASFTLSAFGDEIAPDLESQLALLRELRIGSLELRTAWGRNVLDLDDEDLSQLQRCISQAGLTVSCIGSPIGKSPLNEPIERDLARLERIFHVAEVAGTRNIRIFSFYPPETHPRAHNDSSPDLLEEPDAGDSLAEAGERLRRLVEAASREGFLLLLENEKGVLGDTPRRCYHLLKAVSSASLRFLWDPANFIQVGVEHPMTVGWPLLAPYVAYVHIKDARSSDGAVRAAGEGDGQLAELLAALRDSGYSGMLALEPHLASAGRDGGFSGVTGMTYAVQQLRRLMARAGCMEVAWPP